MKNNLIFAGVLVALAALIIVSRAARQGQNDADDKGYGSVIAVEGFHARPEPFQRTIEATGTLTGNKESVVAAETSGRVLEVFVAVGDYVHSGDPLARLDDTLYQVDADRAKLAYDKAKLDLERVEKLFAQNSISQSDLEGARLGVKGAELQYQFARKTFNNATIRAPFSGAIATKFTEVGQMLERGMPVVQLVDIGSLKLTVPVTEEQVQFVETGAEASVIIDAIGDTVTGRVTAVGSRANPGSRTFPVEIQISGGPNRRSGMFARAVLSAGVIPDAILVPRAAILSDAGRYIVYLAQNNTAQKTIVTQVGISGDRVAVTGVKPDDIVVTTGNQNLINGSALNLTLTGGAAQ